MDVEMPFETKQELREALARRLGLPIDGPTWRTLQPDWSGPYDNADVTELLQSASGMGLRRKRRQGLRSRLSSELPALEEDVEETRVVLGMQWGRLMDGQPLPPFREVIELLSTAWAEVLAADLFEEEPTREALDRALGVYWWWGAFVGQVASLAIRHRIRVSQATEHLSGMSFPRGRSQARELAVLQNMPQYFYEELVEIVERERQGKRHQLWRFLNAVDGGYIGRTWDDALGLFNHMMRENGLDARYDTSGAFLMAVKRNSSHSSSS